MRLYGRYVLPRLIDLTMRTPLWRRIGGGCHLGRPIDALLTQGGFQVEHLERGYTPGPRPFAYLYRGVARPRASRQTPHHEGDTP